MGTLVHKKVCRWKFFLLVNEEKKDQKALKKRKSNFFRVRTKDAWGIRDVGDSFSLSVDCDLILVARNLDAWWVVGAGSIDINLLPLSWKIGPSICSTWEKWAQEFQLGLVATQHMEKVDMGEPNWSKATFVSSPNVQKSSLMWPSCWSTSTPIGLAESCSYKSSFLVILFRPAQLIFSYSNENSP